MTLEQRISILEMKNKSLQEQVDDLRDKINYIYGKIN